MPIVRRKNIRLQGYDYSTEGGYFITIVTKDRQPLFGNIVDGEMVLNEYGRIVESTWNDLINHNPNIGLDEFVVMPNHVHGIVVIFDSVGAGSRDLCAPERSLREEKPAPLNQAGCEPAPTRDINRVADEPTPTRNVNRVVDESAPTEDLSCPVAETFPAPTQIVPLSEIVRQFKTFSARRINTLRKTSGLPVWQRNYYDHIIRSDNEHEEIAAYIANNPATWLTDTERPSLEN